MRLPSEPPPNPQERPNVLEYGRPKGASTGPIAATAAMLVGFVLSVGAIGGIGFAAFIPTHPTFPYPPPAPAKRHWIPIFSFFLAGVSAIALAVYVWRSRPASRWFLLGLLIGAAVMGLLEGACFVPPS
jgi:hypothetical protein